MKETMTQYPHNGSFEWKSEECMLGHVLQWDTPESLHEHFPLFDSTGNTVFMAVGRIDNREELFRLLTIPNPERERMADGQLMFRAYLAWGKEACRKLYGDWSFCAWHKQEKKLFLARDHSGIMALYYYLGQDFLVFASTLKGLLCLPNVPKDINELRVVQLLTAWPGDGEATYYQHILNLKPGHFLEIQDGRVQKTRFWELTEQPELILPKEEDYFEQFRELFSDAVKTRLRSYNNVGIMLSGGYDSTSVAAIAATELARQNKELFAFTSVPHDAQWKVPKGKMANEGPLAATLARKYPNIRHYLIGASNYPVFESVDKALEMFGEPLHAAGNQYWIQAIFDAAKENNVHVLLNAQGGNGVISWPTGKPRLFAKKGLPLLKYRVKMALTDVHTLVKNPEYFRYPFLEYSFISREYVKKFRLKERMKASGHDPKFRKKLPFKRAQRELMAMCFFNAYSLHYRMALNYGINAADPCSHVPLLLFMLSVPEQVYRNHDYQRIFIEIALRDFLPEEILMAKEKGLQAADLPERIFSDISLLSDAIFLNGKTEFLDEKRYMGAVSNWTRNRTAGQRFRMDQKTVNHWLRTYSVIKMTEYECKKNNGASKKAEKLV